MSKYFEEETWINDFTETCDLRSTAKQRLTRTVAGKDVGRVGDWHLRKDQICRFQSSQQVLF
jgi:hypothetical protein